MDPADGPEFRAPSVSRQAVRERLPAFERGDNRITELSRVYRIELGTGWYTPPGLLRAPGSVLTYALQWNSYGALSLWGDCWETRAARR